MYKDIKIIPDIFSIKMLDISDEEYFGRKYADYISNSKLSLINPKQGGSVKTYIEGLGKHQKVSSSLSIGSAVHELVLQPEGFFLEPTIDKPTGKMGSMADYIFDNFDICSLTEDNIIAASNAVNYYAGNMSEKKIQNVRDKCYQYWIHRLEYKPEESLGIPIYSDKKSRDCIMNCVDSIKNNEQIQELLHPCGALVDPFRFNEITLLLDVKVIHNNDSKILHLKAKIDNCTISIENESIVLNDLKTTGHYIDSFEDSFHKYFYNRQMAMYLWMLRMYTEANYYNYTRLPKMNVNMLLVSTIDYKSGIFRVTNKEIRKGFKSFIDLLKRAAFIELYK